MPIYAYRCAACGHARDVLQKMSDAPLSVCPVCSAEQFQKQVTAAGFQLKGTGWYATDFRNNGSAPAPKTTAGVAADSATSTAKTEGATGDGAAAPGGSTAATSGGSAAGAAAASSSTGAGSAGSNSPPPPSASPGAGT